jgi:hypothetical protein
METAVTLIEITDLFQWPINRAAIALDTSLRIDVRARPIRSFLVETKGEINNQGSYLL